MTERSARYSDLFDTGGPVRNHGFGPSHAEARHYDCEYCPVCAAIAIVRKTHPEVLEHLSNAARELLAAAAMVLSEAERHLSEAEDENVGDAEKTASKSAWPQAEARGVRKTGTD
ncbi:MAG TPA: DUF5304 family protein [Actinomycetota bacterium]|jgi:hypothetical protein|nr:DUF5304 family protein [Actinomycetota bacterium]